MSCTHTISGCNYPEGDCHGDCGTKPEPLMLADWLSMGPLWQHKNSAAALRRLHAENADLTARLGHATRRALIHKQRADDLLEAIKPLVPHVLHYASMPQSHDDAHRDAASARAAIANAERTAP